MSRESFFPYPPRPGVGGENQAFNLVDPHDMLSEKAARSVIEFEHQLYSSQLDGVYFPTAVAYQEEQAESGQPLPQFESIWQKKVNSTTLGVSYFMTDKGRAALQKATGVELQAITTEDYLRQLSSLEISNLSSKILGKLEDESVGFEEESLTRAFIEGGFDEKAIPEPQFLAIYKSPEVILEKARGYRQLKIYISKALSDLMSGSNAEDPQTKSAKILLATLYRRRLNNFIANAYVEAYKFAHQARLSGRSDYRSLLDNLEERLPAFSQPPTVQVARFLVRMDHYRYGVSVGEEGKFTWLSHEAQSQANLADQEIDDSAVDRGMYADIEPDKLDSTEIESSTFGELLCEVLKEYNLLSEYSEWDSERQTPAPDGKWQVIVDGRFKSLAVGDQQRVMKVPDKPVSLMRAITVGSHEVTHVLQNHNKRLVGELAILERIGLDNVSEQTESGGIWQEREARQMLTGRTENTVSGTGYLKTLSAKAEGASFGKGVKLYYEYLLREDPTMSPEKAAAQAVNRARRAYRSGGFEYARDLPVLTNSQPLRYLEQELIYKNLTPERRKLLFIGGVSIANLLELSAAGLVNLDQMFIPEKKPWELMYPRVKNILTVDHS